MKSLFVLSFLLSSSALASEVKLQPYFPSPFPGLPFALAPQCFLHGVGSDGEWHGMCHYYGGNPRNPGAYALVEWDTTGTALSATQCYLYSFQGAPVCPAKVYGPFETIDGVRGWVQGIDAAGNTGLEVDGTGTNIPVLLMP
jgi:hypothetical protein